MATTEDNLIGYLDMDYIAAIALALAGAADEKSAVTVIQAIVDAYGSFQGSRTEPTKILLDAVRHVDGRFTT